VPTVSKFTAERRDKIVQALQVGASRRTASHIAGIDESNLRRWLVKGAEAAEGTRFREFYEEVRRAEASPSMRALGIIYKEMPDNPMLAWRFIERKEPGYEPPAPFAPSAPSVTTIHLSFHDGGPLDSGAIDAIIEGEIVEQDDEPAEVHSLPAPTRPA
jgi:hypothetical protein